MPADAAIDGRLSILLLCDFQRGNPNTMNDHIRAFKRFSRHEVELFNPRGLARSRFLDLDRFDVVVIHYSLVLIWDDYISPAFREQLRTYDGLKVQFLQDEYRMVDDITAEMRRIGVDVLYSVVPPAQIDAIYRERLPDTEILPTLTGYVPENLVGRKVPRPDERPIDVGYRGRSTPLWLGRLGFEKIEIGRGFLQHASASGLRLDIAWTESARIYGERWIDFVTSCRTMLASESGSSLVDFDGSIERDVRLYLAAHPTADYHEVEDTVLRRYEGGPIINTSSPRLFEAAALGSGMILHPGEYSGLVRPWEHYVPLEKDFSNIDEVVARVRDTPFVEGLVDRAYEELIASGAYSERVFIEGFDDDMAARVTPRGRVARHPRRRLQLEQLSAGRSYYVSSFYRFAREFFLAWIGIRETLRHRQVRRLAVRARRHRRAATPGGTTLWDDIFRLAVLKSVAAGALRPTAPFRITPSYDAETRTLTLTSHPPGEAPAGDAVAAAVAESGISDLVWNHAAVGQFVGLPIPIVHRRVSFDVGRYDAYGVYRFDRLAAFAQERPEAVLAALEPLLEAHVADDGRISFRQPATLPPDEGEADT